MRNVLSTYLKLLFILQRHYNQLKEELAKMKPPSDLDSDMFKMAVQNGPISSSSASAAAACSSAVVPTPSTSSSVSHKPPNGTSSQMMNMNMNHTDAIPDEGLLSKMLVNKDDIADLADSSPSDSSSPSDNDTSDNINTEILFL